MWRYMKWRTSWFVQLLHARDSNIVNHHLQELKKQRKRRNWKMLRWAYYCMSKWYGG
jgi:hypothetical protein